MNAFTVISEYADLVEADMACQGLRAAGFDASILDEAANRYLMQWTGAIVVRARVQVPTEQAEEAAAYLQRVETGEAAKEAEASFNEERSAQWAAVAQFDGIGEADIACSRMRAEGIDAWVSDDFCSFMGVNEPLSSKRRLLLNVPTERFQEASAILQAIEEGAFEDEEPPPENP